MSLIEKIKEDQEDARKGMQKVTASLLTTLLGEANMVAKNAQRDAPTDEEVVVVIRRFLRSNAETQEALRKANAASDGALGIAMAEQAILERYMPQRPPQLSEDELKTIIQGALLGGIQKAIGPLMGFLKTRHAGQYDGKVANAVITAVLATKATS